MLRCLNTSGNLGGSCSEMTVLERQSAIRKKCQQQEQRNNHYEVEQQQGILFCGTGYNDVFCSSSSSSSLQVENPQGLMMMMMMMMDGGDSTIVVKPDPGLENGWPELGKLNNNDNNMAFGSCSSSCGFDASPAISRTCSSPWGRDSLVSATEKKITSSPCGKESLKKRKAGNPKVAAVVGESDNKEKRVKVSGEEESSKVTEQNSNNNNNKNGKSSTISRSNNKETCGETSKENSKGSEVQNQKPDYIHVRARRGQATDSHSLAERVRREKISERMKYLQDLVPGCSKITGKAGMLDEIINYVQSLQRQVEFLSMKLAAVNPRLDFNIEDLFAKEVFPACAPSFPTIGMPSEMTNPPYLDFNSSQAQQLASSCGGLINNMGINPSDMGLRKTITAPVSFPETILDSSSCFTHVFPSSTWEGDFQIQNLYNVAFDQARASSFPSQPFTGSVEGSNLKMEM